MYDLMSSEESDHDDSEDKNECILSKVFHGDHL